MQEKGIHQKDTLLDPPSYFSKWVITNPPYLARNKAKDKTLFDKYRLDDLYKIAISTFFEAEGGILIIPINFFSDKNSEKIRKNFLERFKILELNVFDISIFDSTSYNVCSFSFVKANKKLSEQSFLVNKFLNENSKEHESFYITLKEQYNYRIGGDFFSKIESSPKIFSRYIEGQKNLKITHLYINCIDRKNERINISYRECPHLGKKTDRVFATLTSKEDLSQIQEKILIKMTNELLEDFRKATHDLSLTNYRDRGRKRMGFEEMYQLCSYCFQKIKE